MIGKALARPLLMVDIDGVVSLFGFPPRTPPAEGSFHWVDGIPHFLSAAAARHLLALGEIFELVWCSGWEERADEHLPHLLGLPAGLPFLRFERARADTARNTDTDSGLAGTAEGVHTSTGTHGHWKLAAIDAYAGLRPLAWIDDCLDEVCHAWADARAAPTLLVQSTPASGLTEREASELVGWARGLRCEQ